MHGHSVKAFTRGRNGYQKPTGTGMLKLLNQKLLREAVELRQEWDRHIRSNRLLGFNGQPLANPITKYPYLHPTKGYRTERF